MFEKSESDPVHKTIVLWDLPVLSTDVVSVREAGPEAGETREDRETASRDQSSAYAAQTKHRVGRIDARPRQVGFLDWEPWRKRESGIF